MTYLRSCVPRENPPHDNVATARRALLLLMYRYHVYSGRKGCALKRGIVHSSVYYKKYSGNCRQGQRERTLSGHAESGDVSTRHTFPPAFCAAWWLGPSRSFSGAA